MYNIFLYVWCIGMFISRDSRSQQKEIKKFTKYHDLKVKVERLWEKKATVAPVVKGTLKAIPKDL